MLGDPLGDQIKNVGDFDYNSIMIYGTWQAAQWMPDDENEVEYAELYGINEFEPGAVTPLYQGGNENPALAVGGFGK